MSLGKRLKAERERHGWSQIFVASKIGITNTVLSNYERDYRDPDTETLGKLADLYEVTTDCLLKGTLKNVDTSVRFTVEPANPDPEKDFHFYNTDGVQFIARSKQNLSPDAFRKMQELAKKAREIFDDDEDQD
ncbi:helix-turn-helix domain-containing protein [Paenibacillus solisilvae]|uniref:Helix-turn-helix domain-containing protein n=1 Tax=Paenibacillus solisilvae TaxID=2486751 RepID=A0ABW0VRZ9_9BACL